MTGTKSKRKSVRRSRPLKIAKRKSSKRPTPVDSALSAAAKTRVGTKSAQLLAMLSDRAGTTISAMMAATGWQEHSVRGFFAGIVRKKLRLNLVSEAGDDGRVYRIIDARVGRMKQAA